MMMIVKDKQSGVDAILPLIATEFYSQVRSKIALQIDLASAYNVGEDDDNCNIFIYHHFFHLDKVATCKCCISIKKCHQNSEFPKNTTHQGPGWLTVRDPTVGGP